jgi:hypothetical protein
MQTGTTLDVPFSAHDAEMLLQAGANVDGTDRDGATYLAGHGIL